MVIRLVKFKSALSDAEVLKLYEERAPRYRQLPGLLQKYYIKDQKTGEHGAVYIWDSMRSMEEFQNSELSRSIPQTYRIIGEPTIEILNLVYTLRPTKNTGESDRVCQRWLDGWEAGNVTVCGGEISNQATGRISGF